MRSDQAKFQFDSRQKHARAIKRMDSPAIYSTREAVKKKEEEREEEEVQSARRS
jgi:hypothetical protein